MKKDYEDIRPYNDSEVKDVLDKLFNDKIFKFIIKPYLKCLMPDWNKKERKRFAKEFSELETIDGIQKMMAEVPLDQIVKHKIDELSISGLENVDPTKNHLFISNHRDILMDPFLINYVLYNNEIQTPLNAFGSNLGYKYIGDLLRLNKSFIVKRGEKEIIEYMRIQSEFITNRLEKNNSIWIAQREGRSKNGVDATNPAVVFMLYMESMKQGLSYNDFVEKYSIIPLSISYEYEPCDVRKAKEMYTTEKNGSYKKGKLEDFWSIRRGIIGWKGNVHIAFGTELAGDFNSKHSIAKALDEQIIDNYKLWDTNLSAHDIMYGTNLISKESLNFMKFKAYLDEQKPHLIPFIEQIYAAPIQSKLKLGKSII